MNSQFVFCSDVGKICNLPSRSQNVSFGADGTYHYRDVQNQSSIQCGPEKFGSPNSNPGIQQKCYRRDIPVFDLDTDGTPLGFTKCADESGLCRSPFDSDVLYGSDGHYYSGFVRANVPIACNSNVFGNPNPNSTNPTNACYVRQQGQIIPINPNISPINPNISPINPNISPINPNISPINPNILDLTLSPLGHYHHPLFPPILQ